MAKMPVKSVSAYTAYRIGRRAITKNSRKRVVLNSNEEYTFNKEKKHKENSLPSQKVQVNKRLLNKKKQACRTIPNNSFEHEIVLASTSGVAMQPQIKIKKNKKKTGMEINERDSILQYSSEKSFKKKLKILNDRKKDLKVCKLDDSSNSMENACNSGHKDGNCDFSYDVNELTANKCSLPDNNSRRLTIKGTDLNVKYEELRDEESFISCRLNSPDNKYQIVQRMDSVKEGKKYIQQILNPMNISNFFQNHWETNYCLIKRSDDKNFSQFISFEQIDNILNKNHLEFTTHLDITKYINGVRKTLNPSGRALPSLVWNYYNTGCTIRLLNPHLFLPNLFSLNAMLQEYFHSLVGANAYLTPPNSQGFAPHYDDIEAFILQIEGRKHWKLYKPLSKQEYLPRESSRNFSQTEIGNPIFDDVLEAGDVLYFPRGTIHQARTDVNSHSLHITLSVYQKQTYADLLEAMLPHIFESVITENIDMRRGLPLDCWRHAGYAFSDQKTLKRKKFQNDMTKVIQKSIQNMPIEKFIDKGIDQLAKRFQHEALPPNILSIERSRTIYGCRNYVNGQGICLRNFEIKSTSKVRLLRANIIRLVMEREKNKNEIRLYYYSDNSKLYCEYEANYIEVGLDEAIVAKELIKAYPEYRNVCQLPLLDEKNKFSFIKYLWERGILMTEEAFQ